MLFDLISATNMSLSSFQISREARYLDLNEYANISFETDNL